MSPAKSGAAQAWVWQYAVTPRKPADSAACRATYASDDKCYAPGLPHSEASYIDMDMSDSPAPSRRR